MNFQFFHDMENNKTISVCHSYTKEDFKLLMPLGCFIVGIAHCSPQDQYSRAEGRRVSIIKGEEVNLKRYSVIWEEEKTYHIFKSDNKYFTFCTSDKSERVYFVHYEERN